MNFNQPPGGNPEGEKIEFSRVLKLIGDRGLDTEAKELYGKWLDQEQALVKSSADSARISMKMAEVYLAVGDTAGALECLDGAEGGDGQDGVVYQVWMELEEAKNPDSARYSNLAERDMAIQVCSVLHREISTKIKDIRKMMQE